MTITNGAHCPQEILVLYKLVQAQERSGALSDPLMASTIACFPKALIALRGAQHWPTWLDPVLGCRIRNIIETSILTRMEPYVRKVFTAEPLLQKEPFSMPSAPYYGKASEVVRFAPHQVIQHCLPLQWRDNTVDGSFELRLRMEHGMDHSHIDALLDRGEYQLAAYMSHIDRDYFRDKLEDKILTRVAKERPNQLDDVVEILWKNRQERQRENIPAQPSPMYPLGSRIVIAYRHVGRKETAERFAQEHCGVRCAEDLFRIDEVN
jgi:hypothetical protein